MIRMVEMSVRLGIKSHGWELGTKKGRACRASPSTKARDPERGWSLDQIPQTRKGFGPSSTGNWGIAGPWDGYHREPMGRAGQVAPGCGKRGPRPPSFRSFRGEE